MDLCKESAHVSACCPTRWMVSKGVFLGVEGAPVILLQCSLLVRPLSFIRAQEAQHPVQGLVSISLFWRLTGRDPQVTFPRLTFNFRLQLSVLSCLCTSVSTAGLH